VWSVNPIVGLSGSIGENDCTFSVAFHLVVPKHLHYRMPLALLPEEGFAFRIKRLNLIGMSNVIFCPADYRSWHRTYYLLDVVNVA
jgi:hypothetical protein